MVQTNFLLARSQGVHFDVAVIFMHFAAPSPHNTNIEDCTRNTFAVIWVFHSLTRC